MSRRRGGSRTSVGRGTGDLGPFVERPATMSPMRRAPSRSHPSARKDVALPTALAAVAALLLPACGGAPSAPALPADAPNVLLVQVDTLRVDRLGFAGHDRPTSPAMDELAARSLVFDRAYAPSPWTLPSMASIHTGLYPSSHGLQRPKDAIPPEARTLAEVLAQAGYRTDSIVANFLVNPYFGHSQGFATFDTEDAKGDQHVSTPGVTARALDLLADYADDAPEDGPFFLSLLYFDPHYDWLAHGLGFAADGPVGRLTGEETIDELRELAATGEGMTDAEVDELRARYDEEIALTDGGIGQLLAALDTLGLADDTLVVLTADHGEEFLEHGWLGHTRFLYEGMVHVPLLVHDPRATGSFGTHVDTVVSTVSVMPTVLDLVGLDPELHGPDEPSLADFVRKPFLADALQPHDHGLDERVDGRVFLEVDFVPTQEKNLAKVAHLQGVVSRDLKWIVDTETGAVEAYDLRDDPGETRNLAPAWLAGDDPADATTAAAMQRFLDAWRAACVERALPRHQGNWSEEELDQLSKLGYLDSGE